jgi:hypothetical protein
MKPSIFAFIAVMILLLGAGNINAQQRPRPDNKNRPGNTDNRSKMNTPQGNPQQANRGGNQVQRTYEMKKNREPKPYPPTAATIIHDRRGRTDRDFRDDRANINFHGHDYSYSDGRYYMRHDNEYRVVPPPHGIRVNIIPNGFFTVMVRDMPFYYYEGVYYRHYQEGNYYEVVAPPMGAIVPDLPDYGVRTLYINGMTVLEYDGVLYKPVNTRWGVEYKVVGMLNNNLQDDLYY